MTKKKRLKKIVKYKKLDWNNDSTLFLLALVFPLVVGLGLTIFLFADYSCCYNEFELSFLKICSSIGLLSICYPIITIIIRKKEIYWEEM